MTTAHRPTWKAAVGRTQESAGGAKTTLKSIRDAPSHTKLKSRIQSSSSHNNIDNENDNKWEASLQKLKKLEEEALKQKNCLLKGPRKLDDQYHTQVEEEARHKLLLSNVDVDDIQIRNKYDDDDDDEAGNDRHPQNSHNNKNNKNKNNNDSDTDLDLDDDSLHNDDSSNPNSSDDDSQNNNHNDDDDDDDEDGYDSEDEVAALQAELAKIRAEREQAKLKAQAQAKAIQDAELEEAALTGNPLLASSFQNNNHDHTTAAAAGVGVGVVVDGKLKKRTWNDDVVFRNQAKGEPQIKKRFINDTVRNDFHKRFLDKFIK